MTERVEEIRLDREGIAHFLNEQHQGWHDGMGSLSQTRVYGTALLLADAVRAALAQAERERDQEKALRVKAIDRLDEVLTEVERLKGELNEAKEEVRRQVEVRMLDQRRHHVDLQETPSQIVPESLCSCGESLRELDAALTRVRAALDWEHICVMEACCNDAVRVVLEGLDG